MWTHPFMELTFAPIRGSGRNVSRWANPHLRRDFAPTSNDEPSSAALEEERPKIRSRRIIERREAWNSGR